MSVLFWTKSRSLPPCRMPNSANLGNHLLLGDVDLDSIPPEELETLAEKHDLKETIKAAKKIWSDTEVSRKLVREYIAEKKKLRESRGD